ncbi:replication-relaxation family protein [Paraburkholderia adhaesiva]|uniref:replication-relaxation family protein n=1 Tax=Paraburkholderia adhaesiva TaxID=2883244 RepID=UPI001F390B38|nr:replication-relaxation family protein [Paraburkholderia adhaesiva]
MQSTLPESPTIGNDTATTPARRIDRGLTQYIAPSKLKLITRTQALTLINRLRVVRTIDVAAGVFPERSFKAALTAAQRVMGKLVRDGLVRRYVTDRHQHVYGLTTAGARWLNEQGSEASASIRRVTEMSNPEHLLWAGFITLCCEARGIPAMTESEALREIAAASGNRRHAEFLSVEVHGLRRALRPDALAFEGDGVTWFEIDRSKRGADREAALVALAMSVGTLLTNGMALRRVVVTARNPRIMNRAMSLLRERIRANAGRTMNSTNERRMIEHEAGSFDVRALVFDDARQQFVEQTVGQVIVQLLPTWLPRSGQSSNSSTETCWLNEHDLPYRRPERIGAWPVPQSPLIDAIEADQ